MQAMCQSLASHPGLVLPSSLYKDHSPSLDETTTHLQGLVQRDPAAFLQRYGALLGLDDLTLFSHLRSDYEVNHWLVQYGLPQTPAPNQVVISTSGAAVAALAESDAATTTGRGQQGQQLMPVRSTAVHARNRRLAAMQQLQAQGEFFDMEVMKARAPLLYHQMVGQFMGEETPQAPRAAPGGDGDGAGEVPGGGAGMLLSNMLLAQHDRAHQAMQLSREQDEEDEQMSEHETEEEEEEEEEEEAEGEEEDGETALKGSQQGQGTATGGVNGVVASGGVSGDRAGGPGGGARHVSVVALARRRREFTQEMEQRFLFGHDVGHVDYQDIDQDTQLDEHWAVEAGRDAEDRYFEGEDDDVAMGGEGELESAKGEGTGHGQGRLEGEKLSQGTETEGAETRLAADEYDY